MKKFLESYENFWRYLFQLKPRNERKTIFKVLDAIILILAGLIILYALLVDQPLAIFIVSFMYLIPLFFAVSFVEGLMDKRKRNAIVTGISTFLTLIAAIIITLAVYT
ncbi:hypothetical protein [Oceanobacillus locisalsi]|uniref:DUF3953 domain-containing protein n=1 Tax=Oceanobacillus locisalsi TaxID=546107 RepID=A0ABW3NAM7_9BACI